MDSYDRIERLMKATFECRSANIRYSFYQNDMMSFSNSAMPPTDPETGTLTNAYILKLLLISSFLTIMVKKYQVGNLIHVCLTDFLK